MATKDVRIGVLGGTFDPPHLGHLIVASDAFDALGLDRLLLVPAAVPPHKRGTVEATAEQRLQMVRLAVRGDARFEVDPRELERTGPSYTVDTLRELHAQHSGCELFFLIGEDALRDLHSWRSPEVVARLAQLVMMSRAGERHVPAMPFGARPLEVTRVDISATEVRRRVAAGESIRYFVPEAVRTMIYREGLYR